LRRIAFLYEVGKLRRECVALTEQELPKLSHDHQLFGAVLVLAGRAAYDMAREDLVKLWSDLLESDENLRPHAAVLGYHMSVARSRRTCRREDVGILNGSFPAVCPNAYCRPTSAVRNRRNCAIQTTALLCTQGC
jgi:hypothetical protein